MTLDDLDLLYVTLLLEQKTERAVCLPENRHH